MSQAIDQEQVELLSEMIDETTEYYIICDQCKGCTDGLKSSSAEPLVVQGWRAVTLESGRVNAVCPTCVATKMNP